MLQESGGVLQEWAAFLFWVPYLLRQQTDRSGFVLTKHWGGGGAEMGSEQCGIVPLEVTRMCEFLMGKSISEGREGLEQSYELSTPRALANREKQFSYYYLHWTETYQYLPRTHRLSYKCPRGFDMKLTKYL